MDAVAPAAAAACAPEPAGGDGRALLVRSLGRRAYEPVWRAMQAFTDARDEATADELWLVEHEPVFTLGQAGRREHLLAPGDIPVLAVDRGGQVTYHGPGQLVAYPLVDLRRARLGVRELVCRIEQAVIDTLAGYGIAAVRRAGAPGVYVDGAKIAALGLRVYRDRLSVQPSSKGNYLSVRIAFEAQSRADYDAAHGALRALPEVKWTL